AILRTMERECAEDFASGFIAEQPAKLQRLPQYYRAVLGLGPYPSVKCNAPEFSAVLNANGSIQPCFFIAGDAGPGAAGDLAQALNSETLMGLRAEVRCGERLECTTCVCSMWRAPAQTAKF